MGWRDGKKGLTSLSPKGSRLSSGEKEAQKQPTWDHRHGQAECDIRMSLPRCRHLCHRQRRQPRLDQYRRLCWWVDSHFQLDLFFDVRLLLCPWKQGTCHLVFRRFAKQKWNVQKNTLLVYGALVVAITTIQSAVLSVQDWKSNLKWARDPSCRLLIAVSWCEFAAEP